MFDMLNFCSLRFRARSAPSARPAARFADPGFLRRLVPGLLIGVLVVPAARAQTLFSADTEPGLGIFPGLASDVIAVDADGDGRLDLVFQISTGSPFNPSYEYVLELSRGAGYYEGLDGAFPPGMTSGGLAVMRFGDLDGDGDADLVISEKDKPGAPGLPVLSVLHNDGQGRFSIQQTIEPPSTGFSGAGALVLEDFNGDGLLDVAWAPLAADLNLHSGVAGGLLAPAASVIVRDGFTNALGVADVNGDGRSDLIAVGNSTSELLLQGGGVFPDFTAVAGSLPTGRSLAVADLDGDGDDDLALGLNFSGTAVVFDEGVGFGAAVELDESLPGSGSPFRLAAGDVDGDGIVDLVGSEGSVLLWRGLGGGGFGVEESGFSFFQLGGGTQRFALVDLEGDGDLDFAGGSRELSIHDGAGGYESLVGTPPSRLTSADAIADMNGDGWPDRLELQNTGQGFRPVNWLGDGFGAFPTAIAGLKAPGEVVDHALGDVDNDGDVDAYVGRGFEATGGFGRSQAVLINDGTGLMRSISGLSSGIVDSTRAVRLFDANLDGDLDAVVGNRNPGQASGVNRLEKNLGGGKFRDATDDLPPFPGDSETVAVFDIDDDGDLDLIMGQTAGPKHSGQDLVFENDGTGRFVDITAQALPGSEEETVELLVADLNGDGLEDLYQVNSADADFLTGLGSSTDRVLLNDPLQPGRFLAAGAALATPVGNNLTGALLDVDGDGDVDLARLSSVFSPFGSLNSILLEFDLNDGAGVFSAALPGATDTVPNLRDYFIQDPGVLAAADVDLDGDPDLLLDGFLLRGLRRELELLTTVELGQEALFRVRSSAGSSGFLLAYSGAEAALPLPGLGLLRLDLSAPSSVVANGTLGTDGVGLVSLAAPALPGLGGLELFWQALVVGPDGLTRAVRSVF